MNEDDRVLLEQQLEKVVRAFVDPELFLHYMRYFVLFEDNGDSLSKKIAGYISPKESTKPSASPRSRHKYFYGLLGSKLQQQPAMKNQTMVVVTDRYELPLELG